ncbi:MAG: ROK family protein [Luteitalea sp.]|nr:ROK family protein [Luteitalea sp.]
MIGLEVREDDAVAVALDSDGRLVAQADAREPGDAAAAAVAALGRLGPQVGPVAMASPAPESDWCVAAIAAVARDTGTGVTGPVVASGTAAAIAEASAGAARGVSNVVFFGIADHVSAGILRDGLPLTGAGRAPALAWLGLNPVERDDYRRIGCLEAEVASAGIVRRLVWRIKAGDRSRVGDAVGGELSAITLEHILAAARGGDGVSISVMRDTARYLAMAAANLALIVEPDVLVVGGIMASAADLLLDAIRLEAARRLPPDITRALTIVPAMFAVEGPAIGAARFASAAPQ